MTSVEFVVILPPLIVRSGENKGGKMDTYPENPKIFGAFGAILLLFLLIFGVFFMFLIPETIVLALVFQNVRACGAYFSQTFRFTNVLCMCREHRSCPVNQI